MTFEEKVKYLESYKDLVLQHELKSAQLENLKCKATKITATYSEIAEKLNRTIGSICYKVKHMGINKNKYIVFGMYSINK